MKERGMQRGKEKQERVSSEFRSEEPEGKFENWLPSSDGAPTPSRARRYTSQDNGLSSPCSLSEEVCVLLTVNFLVSKIISKSVKKAKRSLHLRYITVTCLRRAARKRGCDRNTYVIARVRQDMCINTIKPLRVREK